jgi:HK97 family phage portal protein
MNPQTTSAAGSQGSAILNAWRAGRESARAGASQLVQASSDTESGLTAEEFYQRLSGMGSTWAGPPVTEDSAMRQATVYACAQLLAGVISTLPLGVFERKEEGRAKVDHDYWWLLNERANTEMSSSTVWTYLVKSMLFHGDGFLKIERPSAYSNRVIGFTPLHPMRVHPFHAESDGRLLYRITPRTGAQYTLDPSDIIHVPTLGFDGLRSCSPITHAARQNIGIALAAEEYSARFFSNGAMSEIALKSPKKLDKEQADDLRASFMARYSGTKNAHVPIVLQGGLELEVISITPQDAALLQTRMFSGVEEICRVMGVPPFMVGHTEKTSSWGTGIEQMSIGFVKFGLMSRLVPIAQEFNHKLWPTRSRFFVEHNTAALERGDYKTRMEGYRILAGRAGEAPVMRINEIRKLENLPPDDELQALQTQVALKGKTNGKDDDDDKSAQIAQ